MIRSSLTSMFASTALVAVALYTLRRPSVAMTTILVAALAVALATSSLLALKRFPSRYFFAGAGLAGWVYLAIADGGMFPSAAASLPTERLLGRCLSYISTPERIDSGFVTTYVKRPADPVPESLLLWVYRAYVRSFEFSLSMDAYNDQIPIVIELPEFTFVTVTTTVSISIPLREEEAYRSYLIAGHCWFAAIFALASGLACKALAARLNRVRAPAAPLLRPVSDSV